MWKDKKSGSSHQLFHVNEPFFHDGGYKTNKAIKFFYKKQINEFFKVEIFIMLNSHNVKVIFIVFMSKM